MNEALPAEKAVEELEQRGIRPSKLSSQDTTRNPAANLVYRGQLGRLLKMLLLGEKLAERSPHSRLVWSEVTFAPSSPEILFFSEVAIVPWGRTLVFCAPYIPSPKDYPQTAVAIFDPDSMAWSHCLLHESAPNPFMVFKRMPVIFVFQDELYLAYSDFEINVFVIQCFDLLQARWRRVETSGSLPPTFDFMDGVFYNGFLYISGPVKAGQDTPAQSNVVYQLNLETLEWKTLSCTGTPPDFPNGASVLYENCLVCFSQDGDHLFRLDLDKHHWECTQIVPLQDFLPRRHTHLLRAFGNYLILLRACDGFVLNLFDMTKLEWQTERTMGKRPNRVRTEASYAILGHKLYCLSGQATKSQLLQIKLEEDPEAIFKKQDTSLLPKWTHLMWNDGFEDVTFRFLDGSEVSLPLGVCGLN